MHTHIIVIIILPPPSWSQPTQEVSCFSMHVTVNGVQLPPQDAGKQLTQSSLPTPVQWHTDIYICDWILDN